MSAQQTTVRRPVVVVAAIVAVGITLLVGFCYGTTKKKNTDTDHFDALLVLGTPALQDGKPSRQGRWLITEAVRELRAGKANYLIISGADVANHYVEADVLQRLAREMSVPAELIVEDREAHDTLENVRNAEALMKQRGWRSVEVIGLPEHLHRTSVLLEGTSLQWSTHAAPTPGRSFFSRAIHTLIESIGTTILRVFGVGAVPVLHRVKRIFWHKA